MRSIGQTWALTSIGAVVEMGVLSTLKRLPMESIITQAKEFCYTHEEFRKYSQQKSKQNNVKTMCSPTQ
jgi:hypothetical protein